MRWELNVLIFPNFPIAQCYVFFFYTPSLLNLLLQILLAHLFFPALFHQAFSKSIFLIQLVLTHCLCLCTSFFSWMFITSISPQQLGAEAWDYRLQGARGFTFPENPNLSNKLWWLATKPCLLKERPVQRAHAVLHQQTQIFFISVMVVEFCCKLAAIWPLPQMLKLSKPSLINITCIT